MSEPAIQLRGVSKRYPPREPGTLEHQLLKSVDLEVARGVIHRFGPPFPQCRGSRSSGLEAGRQS